MSGIHKLMDSRLRGNDKPYSVIPEFAARRMSGIHKLVDSRLCGNGKPYSVIPEFAARRMSGIHQDWIPACAGMTFVQTPKSGVSTGYGFDIYFPCW